MTPRFPVEDPSHSGSLMDRTAAYVWGSAVLRCVLIVTLANHAAALVLVFLALISPTMGGLLALLSVLTWFFAVALPMMNREVRARVGAETRTYLGEIVEKFGRVVLFAQTGLYTVLLVYAVY